MIKEAYCSKEVSILLKEKGFDEPTWTCYIEHEISHYDYTFSNSELRDGVISAPTIQMACKWLREVHHLEIYPSHDAFQEHCNWWFSISKFTKGHSDCPYESDSIYFTYEEAVEAAIKYCLENLI